MPTVLLGIRNGDPRTGADADLVRYAMAEVLAAHAEATQVRLMSR